MGDYTTFVLGKDDYEINPDATAIRAVKCEAREVGYVITYSIPVELLPKSEGDA